MTQHFGSAINHTNELPADLLGFLANQDTPLVLKGLVSHWPLVQAGKESQQAAIDYLLSFYNQQPVGAFIAEPSAKGRFFYNKDLSALNFIKQQVNLADLLKQLMAVAEQPEPPAFYMGSTAIEKILPGFLAEQDLALDEQQPLKSIWLGNRTTIAPHFDFPQNIACCVLGKRRFTLFPPEQLENLYLGPIDLTPAGQQISLVDLAEPDLERFPKFKTAMGDALVAELEPGDALYIPPMWFHQVESLSAINGLVNYWWRSSPRYLGSPNDAFLAAILAIKDLPRAQREHWQRLFNYYVFEQPDDALAHLPETARGRLGPLDEMLARQLRAQLLNNFK